MILGNQNVNKQYHSRNPKVSYQFRKDHRILERKCGQFRNHRAVYVHMGRIYVPVSRRASSLNIASPIFSACTLKGY